MSRITEQEPDDTGILDAATVAAERNQEVVDPVVLELLELITEEPSEPRHTSMAGG